MLACVNLVKYFGGVKAVDGCSFEVQENTITALIGPNGAGKSTVFNLISGILRADAGQVVLNRKDIASLSVEEISNAGISRIFQEAKLFNNLTVKENLLLALDTEDTKFWKNLIQSHHVSADEEDKIQEALQLVGLERFAERLARELSYGQKRLIELIRAILNPHTFLMLDEPVAGVTPQLREKIGEMLRGLKEKGETVLLIEHDMGFTLSVADVVVVMDHGKVIARGIPTEIKNNPEVLEAYLGE